MPVLPHIGKRWQRPCARNVSRDRIERFVFPTEAIRPASINEPDFGVCGFLKHGFGMNHPALLKLERKAPRHGFGDFSAEGQVLGFPRLPAAFQYGHAVMSQPAQTPPEPGGEGAGAAVIRDHLHPGTDTPVAETAVESVGIRQGVPTAFAGDDGSGEVAGEVRVDRAGQVPLAVVTLLGVLVGQVKAAIKDHPIRVPEVCKQGVAVNQGLEHGRD